MCWKIEVLVAIVTKKTEDGSGVLGFAWGL
jgi:hypothetical protein